MESIKEIVRARYGQVAGSGLSNEQAGVSAVAQAFGYTAAELAAIPAEANMGLSCGNPTATAGLRTGEVVVDLGCGGGLDVFLAATKVGAAGKAIGIDMTTEMIELARRNAARGRNGQPFTNVEFHLATIDSLPLPPCSADCVISNCVINLAPDKPAVFREIARVLKPGGRLAVSDIALRQPRPDELRNDIMAYVGCIAGAISFEEYHSHLLDAGFSAVEVIDTGADLNAYAQVENQGCCCPPLERDNHDRESSLELPLLESSGCGTAGSPSGGDSMHQRLIELLQRYDINAYAASVRIYAVRP